LKLFLLFLIIISTLLIVDNTKADVIGSITTDKNLYDVNDPILITYNLSSDGTGNPTYTDIIVSGYLPSFNSLTMLQDTYMGGQIMEGAGNEIFFKHVKRFTLEDIKETNSSFIQIPPISGTINAFVKPAIIGEYRDFLGKVRIRSTSPGVSKDIFITREKPMIILTNTSMEIKTSYTDSETVIINYFCKNNCSIKVTDIRKPESLIPIFQYGIDINGQKSLTTSDTGIFKQIVINLSNSGYTPEDDFLEVVVEDTKGNKDIAYFFVYQPTSQTIRLDGSSYDVGTNTNFNLTFNNNMGIVYRTPDTTSRYRVRMILISPLDACSTSYTSPTYITKSSFNEPIQGVTIPNNGIVFVSLDGSGNPVIYNNFISRFNCDQSIKVTSTWRFQMMQEVSLLYFYKTWTPIGNFVDTTISANRLNMVNSLQSGTPLIETQKEQLSIKPIIEAFGFGGVLGNLIFAILLLAATFIVLVRFAKIDAKLALIFNGLETWYLAYDGIINWLIIVIIVVLVALLYTTKILKLFRNEQQPPSTGGEGEV